MMHDSVREELQKKIGSGPIHRNSVVTSAVEPVKSEAAAKPNPKPVRTITTELNRQKTSPTLVEFQTKNATLPEWRLQLQNAVRHRKAGSNEPGDDVTAYQTQLVTSGANALKAEYLEEKELSKMQARQITVRGLWNDRKVFRKVMLKTIVFFRKNCIYIYDMMYIASLDSFSKNEEEKRYFNKFVNSFQFLK